MTKPAPHEPAVFHDDLPTLGGSIGAEPEDFIVDERPLYEPSGEGAHVYVRLRKTNATTRDAIRALARAAGVKDRDIGSAGMKDKVAVTSQWLSLPESCRPPETWELPANLEVIETSRHKNKLRTGHSNGNLFQIRVVGARGDSSAHVDRLRSRGLPNYFGPQRFGFGGRNLGDALRWLRGDEKRGRRKSFQNQLLASVLQSELFNRYTSARIALGLDAPLAGEVLRLHGSTSSFRCESPDEDQPRLVSGDVHLLGPMVGPKMLPAGGRALELEASVQSELGLTDADLETLGRFAPGTRRDLWLHPEGLEAGPEQDSLAVSFSLPAGSYATQVIRELTHAPWPNPRLV